MTGDPLPVLGVQLVEARELQFVGYRHDQEAGVNVPMTTPGHHLIYEGPLRWITALAEEQAREFRGGRIDLAVLDPAGTGYVFRTIFDPGRADSTLVRALIPYFLDQGFGRVGLTTEPGLLYVGRRRAALDASARALAKLPGGLGLVARAEWAWILPVGVRGRRWIVPGDPARSVRAEILITPGHQTAPRTPPLPLPWSAHGDRGPPKRGTRHT